jgi:SWI/SNF-related matrix-associated actin-dependent regulator of chromatin subfamily A-like protein 1
MTKPYRYQRKGVDWLEDHDGRGIIGDEMGLGKSFQALLYAQEQGCRTIVIVCEAGLKTNWEREVVTHLGRRADVLYGRVPKPDGGMAAIKRKRIVIINYEILKGHMKFLKKLKPDLIVVDECQKLGNRESLQTRMVRRLSKGVDKLVFLSGTPLVNRPSELWAALNMLDRKRWPSFFSYAHKYCKPEKKPWGWVFNGASNTKHLNKRLRRYMIRRLKSEVLKDLPLKRRIVVPLTISKTDRREYEGAVKDFIGWLSKTKKAKVVKAKKAQALVKAGYLKRLIAAMKLDPAMEWLDRFLVSTDSKIVIFCEHKAIITKLHNAYRRMSVVLDGSVKGKHRLATIDQFNRDKRIRILIGSKAAITGWNGTAADTVAFFEFFWVPGYHTQGEDRTHRIGQKKQVTAYYLAVENTVEEKICNTLQSKQGVISAVLDGKELDKSDLNLFDLFIDQVRKEAKGLF